MKKGQIFIRIYQFFISIKLAVVTLVGLGVLTAVGTFIESKGNQEMANKLVYHSWWMILLLFLLTLNLLAVLVDRWPWKLKHAPFVLAHFGLLFLIFGSALTRYWGLGCFCSY